jgi:hypothetical protein
LFNIGQQRHPTWCRIKVQVHKDPKLRVLSYQTRLGGLAIMSKGKDSKKQNKKKPLKTLMEKRAAKRAKKENKSFSLVIN